MKLFLPFMVIGVFGLLFFKPWQHTAGYKQAGTVFIKPENGSFQLYRHGAPYYVKGASVVDMSMLRRIKASGGNSVRLYNTHNAGALLDSAHKLGLTVTLGLHLQQAGMELNYSDKAAVARQLEKVKKEVLRYKDHPALLMWAVGNETTLFIQPRYSNFFAIRRVLKSIDAVARMIHEADPNHPTTMVMAGVSEPLIRMTNMVCRNIDLLSFNIFSPLSEHLAKIPRFGWSGPYLVTEFGTKGYWSTKKTEWHSRVEQTSYQKSLYLQAQFEAIRNNKANCLGSYVFIWGVKQEYTPTWFSLFSPWPRMGETELSDECLAEWTGRKPACTAPSIAAVTINNMVDEQNIYTHPGKTADVTLYMLQKEKGPLRLRWELQEEVAEYLSTSYKTQKPKVLADSVWQLRAAETAALKAGAYGGSLYTFRFRAPQAEGAYRLLIYAANEAEKVATANACFYVHKN